ncbi:DUF58 domain-containing protein [Oscillospiraceae bacterium OttesenSCG-928-F05]|nr:DUF58 domain-containing protein [Oscillospiraceae bacterium OttesenSCG-928-F05]
MQALWFVIVILVFVMLQMHYYASRGLKGLRYSRFFNKETVFEGESVELVEVLENNKWAPLPLLRVESKISPFLHFGASGDVDIRHNQFHRSVFFLRPFRRIRRRHTVTCLKRGYYDLRSASMTVGDLFGAVRRTADVASSAELFVYPRILSAGELPEAARRFQGDARARRFILPDPILVSGIREYRRGDSRKDVHWGATARTGALQVKVKDHTNAPKLWLIFNCQVSERNWRGLLDTEEALLEGGLQTAAYIAHESVRVGHEVGFLSNGRVQNAEGLVRVPPSASKAHLHQLLRVMACLSFEVERSFHQLLDDIAAEKPRDADFAVVSAYWSPALEKRAEALRALGNSVTHIPAGMADSGGGGAPDGG